MMLKQVSWKIWGSCSVFLLLLILCMLNLDYSALNNFSLDMGLDVLKGLLQVEWTFFYDGSGEDLISLLITTIGIACLGTMIATVFAVPLTLLSAINLWQKFPFIARFGKVICAVLRSFPELIFAIIFVKIVGPGPFAGVMAIGVHQIGMLGKLFTDELEAMDEKLVEDMVAIGANFWQILWYVRRAHVMPMYSSLILNHFEISVRSAATLGLVGAGGIGAPLIFAIQTRNFGKVSIILIGVITSVFILDYITGIIRKKLR